MKATDISQEEYSDFSKSIAQRFEMEIGDKEIDAKLNILSCMSNMHFRRYKKAEDITNSIEDLGIGDIIFFSKTEKYEVYYMLKHFRNCASHAKRIKKLQ